MKPKIYIAYLVLTQMFTFVTISLADEITDTITQGTQYYQENNFSEAANTFDFVAQMIRQKKGGAIGEKFPKPLEGWQADETQSTAVGGAMFGGGLTTSRRYFKGSSEVNITIITDSPMIQSLMMMVSNPIFAQQDGSRVQLVKGQKAIVKYEAENKEGEFSIVVEGKYLVTLNGTNVIFDDLMGYANAFDYRGLTTV